MSEPKDGTRPPATRGRWLPEFLLLSQKRVRGQMRMLGLSTLVGIVAGLGAIVFYTLVQTVEHTTMAAVANYEPQPHPAGEEPLAWLPNAHGPLNVWYLLGIVTVGGLVSGVLVYTVAPEAEGHGTDSVIAAYHTKQGYMRPRVPIVKIISSAITIGTGGSGGARDRSRNRRRFWLRVGRAGGSAAGRATRVAGGGHGRRDRRHLSRAVGRRLFASEVLYRSPEFESEVILPAALGSVVAYSTFASVFGWEPLFAMPDFAFDNAWQLAPYFLLALCMAFLAFLYTRSFYGLQKAFKRVPIKPHFRPPSARC